MILGGNTNMTKATRLKGWSILVIIIIASAPCWTNGEWHEKAEREGVAQGMAQEKMAPSKPREQSQKATVVEESTPSTKSASEKSSIPLWHVSIGTDWWLLLVAALWILALLFLFLSIRAYLKEQR